MRIEWTEGQWEFDFSGLSLPVERPEQIERSLKVVNFVFRLKSETWFIECKDPEGTPLPRRADKIKEMWSAIKNDALLKEHLLPKLYGTFVHLTLTGTLHRGRVRYGVIIGLSDLDAATRLVLIDTVQRVIDRIGPKLRHSRHVPVVEVHNVSSWNAAYPNMSITRHF